MLTFSNYQGRNIPYYIIIVLACKEGNQSGNTTPDVTWSYNPESVVETIRQIMNTEKNTYQDFNNIADEGTTHICDSIIEYRAFDSSSRYSFCCW